VSQTGTIRHVGTRGDEVRTNGDCVGTRYKGVMWAIQYMVNKGSKGNEWFPERVPKPRLGNQTWEWILKAERVPKPKLRNQTQEQTITLTKEYTGIDMM
jgi:uncharacterized protein (DUF2235 family)